jgi:hypothetical protein
MSKTIVPGPKVLAPIVVGGAEIPAEADAIRGVAVRTQSTKPAVVTDARFLMTSSLPNLKPDSLDSTTSPPMVESLAGHYQLMAEPEGCKYV